MKIQLNLSPLEEGDIKLKRPVIISGPCSAESEEQVMETCTQLAATGHVQILRAGIWKPRTRPNSFEGIGSIGLKWLKQAGKETGLPVCVEVANVKHVYESLRMGIDILWIGARTTVNPFAVQEIADALQGVDIPVIVKNPINPDLALWIGALERLNNAGINKLAALHRGFSFYGEAKYRNKPQWEIPIELMRRVPNLPVFCDPSHICGRRDILQEVSQKALDLNFDGIMLESHIQPSKALSDAKQQVTPDHFKEIIDSLVLRDPKVTDAMLQHTLENLREEIDQIDQEVVSTLAKRMLVAEEIGRVKKQNGIKILQPSRWEEIIEKRTAAGEAQGLSPAFTKAMYNAIHNESIRHQTMVMNQQGSSNEEEVAKA